MVPLCARPCCSGETGHLVSTLVPKSAHTLAVHASTAPDVERISAALAAHAATAQDVECNSSGLTGMRSGVGHLSWPFAVMAGAVEGKHVTSSCVAVLQCLMCQFHGRFAVAVHGVETCRQQSQCAAPDSMVQHDTNGCNSTQHELRPLPAVSVQSASHPLLQFFLRFDSCWSVQHQWVKFGVHVSPAPMVTGTVVVRHIVL